MATPLNPFPKPLEDPVWDVKEAELQLLVAAVIYGMNDDEYPHFPFELIEPYRSGGPSRVNADTALLRLRGDSGQTYRIQIERM